MDIPTALISVALLKNMGAYDRQTLYINNVLIGRVERGPNKTLHKIRHKKVLVQIVYL